MTSPVLDAALFYLGRGWSVIPLGHDKRPLVKWKPYSEHLPSEADVRGWWRQWPKANVAIITGRVSGLVVVDVDPDRGGDAEAWATAHPTDVRVFTPRKGMHFFYETNGTPVRNSVDKVAPGVDVRGEGGYVMAPPSQRADGVPYRWVNEPLSGSRMARWQLLEDPPRDTPAVTPGDHWLERMLRGVGAGERNDACARLAGYFIGKCMPPDVVISQLLAWNQLNKPPLPEAEIKTTVLSVAQSARDRAPANEGKTDYDVIRFSQYLAKYAAQPLNWMVKDWLPEQTVGMVVAPPGSYKTWLLQDLAISVASGLPFLNSYPVLRPGPVLFMQQEDWHGQIAHRFSLITARRANLKLPSMSPTGDITVSAPPRMPIWLHEHRGFRFDDEPTVAAWIAQIRRLKPSLVILDPLYSAGSVEDFMAGTARDMFLFKSVRDELGTTFLIAHHTRKTSKQFPGQPEQAPEREDVWGSQFLNAWMETGWQIRKREQPGTASIMRHFKVQSDAHRAVITFNIDTTVVPGKYDVIVTEQRPGDKEAGPDVVEMLEKHGALTIARIAEMSKLHRVTVHRRMENLIKAGVVEKRGSKYMLVGSGLEAQDG